jgi:hypothetical protein
MSTTRGFFCVAGVCLGAITAASAQDATPTPQPGQEQGHEPMTIEELEKRIQALEAARAQDAKDMREELDDLEDELSKAKARASVPAQQSAGAFNPAITVFGNFLARSDSKPVYVDDDPANERVDDRMQLREVEVDFRAAIDPWADGVVITSFESEQPGEFSANIEEGYVLLKKLPFFDSAPGGLKVEVGRFRPAFGRFNTIHLHDLPQVSYPRVVQSFLGSDGFTADGVSGEFFLPSPSENDTLDATVQVLDGGNIAVDPSARASDIALLGHVKWFHDLAPGQDVEIGVSGWSSNSDHQLYGLDATYRWKPYLAGEWHSFLIGGELFQANLDDPALASHPTGFDVWSQYQLDQNLYFGVRYDWLEELENADLHTQTFGAFLPYYTTEFLRFRLGGEHTISDRDELDGLTSVFLELNMVFGSHPAEPYWVNH